MNNVVLKEILFLEDEKIKADFTVEVKGGAMVDFPDVRVVSISEDHKLLKVDSLNKKEKLISRYFNMNYVVDFFFEFEPRTEDWIFCKRCRKFKPIKGSTWDLVYKEFLCSDCWNKLLSKLKEDKDDVN